LNEAWSKLEAEAERKNAGGMVEMNGSLRFHDVEEMGKPCKCKFQGK